MGIKINTHCNLRLTLTVTIAAVAKFRSTALQILPNVRKDLAVD